MARKSGVFWNKTRRARLVREVTNYNKRIARAAKNATQSELKLLPKQVSTRELQQIIKNQKDFERAIKQLQYATSKNLKVKNGTSQFRKNIARFKRDYTTEAARKTKTPKQATTKEAVLKQKAKDIDVTETMGRFPTSRDFLIREIGLLEGNQNNYDLIKKWLNDSNKRARTAQWKENYLRTIKENWEIAIVSNDEESMKILEEIYKIVEGLSLAEFALSQLADQATLSIGQLITSPKRRKGMAFDEERQRGQYQRALEIWKTYGTA